jgi:hypothetical protein
VQSLPPTGVKRPSSYAATGMSEGAGRGGADGGGTEKTNGKREGGGASSGASKNALLQATRSRSTTSLRAERAMVIDPGAGRGGFMTRGSQPPWNASVKRGIVPRTRRLSRRRLKTLDLMLFTKLEGRACCSNQHASRGARNVGVIRQLA